MNRAVAERVQNGAADPLEGVIDELILELEELTFNKIALLLHEVDPALQDWQWSFSSQESYMQATIGPSIISEKASEEILKEMQSDIEIRIKLSEGEVQLLTLAEMWFDSQELLKKLLPPEEAELLPADVGIHSEGNWGVIDVGRQK